MGKWMWIIIVLMVISAVGNCVDSCDERATRPTRIENYCDEAEEQLKDARRQLNALGTDMTIGDVQALKKAIDQIDENRYDEDDAPKKLAQRISQIRLSKKELKELFRKDLSNRRVHLSHTCDTLLTTRAFYPVYLERGECLYYDIEAETPLSSVRILDTSLQSVMKSYNKCTAVSDFIPINHASIYLVEVTPTGREYVNVDVSYRASSAERIINPAKIVENSENCSRGDFMAKEIQGIKMQDAFDEPRKLTLRGQLKASFSGTAVALVPIQVPRGATDILYNLRISTNEKAPSREKDFSEGMNTSYKKVRFMGLPIYESSRSSGLLNTLLGLNQPVREEDAYINMYVFYDAAQARKFQNGTPANQLKYNLDYSTLGTQSCNGRIPTRGQNTVYLAFQNERMRYNNYVWLSAILAIPQTEYVRTTYSLEEPDDEDFFDEDD